MAKILFMLVAAFMVSISTSAIAADSSESIEVKGAGASRADEIIVVKGKEQKPQPNQIVEEKEEQIRDPFQLPLQARQKEYKDILNQIQPAAGK